MYLNILDAVHVQEGERAFPIGGEGAAVNLWQNHSHRERESQGESVCLCVTVCTCACRACTFVYRVCGCTCSRLRARENSTMISRLPFLWLEPACARSTKRDSCDCRRMSTVKSVHATG